MGGIREYLDQHGLSRGSLCLGERRQCDGQLLCVVYRLVVEASFFCPSLGGGLVLACHKLMSGLGEL